MRRTLCAGFAALLLSGEMSFAQRPIDIYAYFQTARGLVAAASVGVGAFSLIRWLSAGAPGLEPLTALGFLTDAHVHVVARQRYTVHETGEHRF
jgi:hypothetical protein